MLICHNISSMRTLGFLNTESFS